MRLNHSITSPSVDHIIDFDQYVTNEGHLFNTHGTGIFTCPEDGTYFFTWTVVVDGQKSIETALVKNGAIAGESISSNSPGDFGTGTGSAVLSLMQYDDVWIKTVRVSEQPIIQPRYTSFAGFKI